MADITKDEVIEWLSNQTVLSLSEIVKELEEKWGVEATAPAAVVVATPAGDADDATEEKDSFDVVLNAAGGNKIAVIKIVREITGLGLKEAKDLVDGAPQSIKEGLGKDEATELEKRLKEAGAEVELK